MFVVILCIIILIIAIIFISYRFITYQSFIQPDFILLTPEARFDHYIERLFQSDDQCTTFDISILQTKYPHEFRKIEHLVVTFKKMEELLMNNRTDIKYNYLHDLYKIWKRLSSEYKTDDKKIVWYPYDRVERFDLPILVKTRSLDNPRYGSIIFKLNKARHFRIMNELLDKGDRLTFEKKKSGVVWRGKSTGYGFDNNIPFRPQSRETLIKKYGDLPPSDIDIGLTTADKKYEKYEKPFMTIDQMLEYRYIISVEGNDVATNLKWIMASNSIVMMPKPTIESWFLENHLMPYVHYIPLKNDFSDLMEQYLKAEQNPVMCQNILRNAKEYVRQFIESSVEIDLQCKILVYYLDHFLWT